MDDIARTLDLEQSVPILDQALRAGLCTPAGLAEARVRAARWPGGPQAARAFRFADGRSTNVGESRSRLAMHLAGLPAPELQWDVRSVQGRFLGRVDFAWPEFGVVGEFDGRAKYTEYLQPGQTEADAVWAEKRREDAIRNTGLWVVRWVWSDLDHVDRIAALLRARFAAVWTAPARTRCHPRARGPARVDDNLRACARVVGTRTSCAYRHRGEVGTMRAETG